VVTSAGAISNIQSNIAISTRLSTSQDSSSQIITHQVLPDLVMHDTFTHANLSIYIKTRHTPRPVAPRLFRPHPVILHVLCIPHRDFLSDFIAMWFVVQVHMYCCS